MVDLHLKLTPEQIDLLRELLEQASDNAEDDIRESDGKDRELFEARRDECQAILAQVPGSDEL